MIYNESPGDIFGVVDLSYAFAHCISRDCKMGAGIAKTFNGRYPGLKSHCLNSNPQVGVAILYEYNGRYIFNLVTKTVYYSKPSYSTMRRALQSMKSYCNDYEIKKIAMPRIGSGLDKLSWRQVRFIIREVFRDTEIEILVKNK